MKRVYREALAKLQETLDLSVARDTIFWDGAIRWLRQEMPADLQAQLRKMIAEDGEFWIAPLHFNWGMAVRNRLREAGFGEGPFGIHNLDNIYVKLVEEAVREGE